MLLPIAQQRERNSGAANCALEQAGRVLLTSALAQELLYDCEGEPVFHGTAVVQELALAEETDFLRVSDRQPSEYFHYWSIANSDAGFQSCDFTTRFPGRL